MKELFNLGEIWVSDFVRDGEEPRAGKHELKMVMDESCGAARLATTVSLDKMFGEYWYKSGTNKSMKLALKDIVDSVLPIKNKGKWLDLAANDGTLLSYVPDQFVKVGVDPAEGDINIEARKHGFIIKNFFRKELFNDIDIKTFDVITCAAMFYDLSDPDKFCSDVFDVLDNDGILVIQQSYTIDMIRSLAFDNILSEHVFYHDVRSMKRILERNSLVITDCTFNNVNGGSFRLFIRKKIGDYAHFHSNIIDFITVNESYVTWDGFYEKVMTLKEQLVSFITKAKEEGKTIMGYGASTKGNTLLQVFGLDHTTISAIADRQPKKWGLKTVSSNIPIISEEEMRFRNPDYLLVLPWHFKQEFIEREKEYLSNGGKMIFPLPKFEIV